MRFETRLALSVTPPSCWANLKANLVIGVIDAVTDVKKVIVGRQMLLDLAGDLGERIEGWPGQLDIDGIATSSDDCAEVEFFGAEDGTNSLTPLVCEFRRRDG